MQTHAVKLDTPNHQPVTKAFPGKNEIVFTDDNKVLWNGMPVDLVTLCQYLDQSQTFDTIPEPHIRPAAHARYALVDQVLAVAKRARVARMGIVGNENFAHDF